MRALRCSRSCGLNDAGDAPSPFFSANCSLNLESPDPLTNEEEVATGVATQSAKSPSDLTNFRKQPIKTKSATYLPGLDGLRGVAILCVVAFHTLNTAPHATFLDDLVVHAADVGWMGVDLFFVLSGFLITGILIDERKRPAYFKTFFSRRVLRIVPVYVVFVLFNLWIAPIVGASTRESALRLREVQGWYWSYSINVFLAVRGWAAATDGPAHLWSLAVEEQFYLLWPFVVLYTPSRALPWAALGCFAAAELCRVGFILGGAGQQVNYVLLPTRMDTLALGALLACAVRDQSVKATVDRWRRPMVWCAVLALVPPLLVQHTVSFLHPLAQLLAFPAIAILSGFFVLRATHNSSVFSVPLLRFLGRYSYGIYIWHWLVINVARRYTSWLSPQLHEGSFLGYYATTFSSIFAASVAIALLSWYVVEQPFLRLKRFFPYV
jgi:peptidoglycan/LPS O-acetylase OafA/YrhL